MNRSVTIAGIRAVYPKVRGQRNFEKIVQGNPWGYFVLRAPSYYVAWLFLRLGISANKTTTLGIIMGVIGCVLLGFGWFWSVIVGAVLINFRALLDYVDGHVARFTNSCSKFGGYLDVLHSYVTSALLPIGLGIGVFNHPDLSPYSAAQFLLGIGADRSIFLVLGISASLFLLATLVVTDRLAVTFQMKPNALYEPKAASRGGLWKVIFRLGLALENVNGVLMPILLLAAIFGFLSTFLVVWWLITACGFIAIVSRTMQVARKVDSIDR